MALPQYCFQVLTDRLDSGHPKRTPTLPPQAPRPNGQGSSLPRRPSPKLSLVGYPRTASPVAAPLQPEQLTYRGSGP